MQSKGHVSDINLIRIDTTLDISQNAEKGNALFSVSYIPLFYQTLILNFMTHLCGMWELFWPASPALPLPKLFSEGPNCKTTRNRGSEATKPSMNRVKTAEMMTKIAMFVR